VSATGPVVTLSPQDYDAVLFDLDGVLTRTASVHAAAWKKLFDAFLEQCAVDTGVAFVPFDIDADYRRYVDGKPRHDGVTAFLQSRGIDMPFGTAEDAPDAQTVRALGKLKDRYFTQHLEQYGAERYQASIALVRTLRAHEIRTAVVSSSNNCAAVLEAELALASILPEQCLPEPGSRGCKPDFRDVTQIYGLLSPPKIVAGLHGEPALGRSPEPFRKAKSHFGADPAVAG